MSGGWGFDLGGLERLGKELGDSVNEALQKAKGDLEKDFDKVLGVDETVPNEQAVAGGQQPDSVTGMTTCMELPCTAAEAHDRRPHATRCAQCVAQVMSMAPRAAMVRPRQPQIRCPMLVGCADTSMGCATNYTLQPCVCMHVAWVHVAACRAQPYSPNCVKASHAP